MSKKTHTDGDKIPKPVRISSGTNLEQEPRTTNSALLAQSKTSALSDLEAHEVKSAYSIQNNISEFLEAEDDNYFVEYYPGAERSEYAYSYEREPYYSTNILESTGHLVKGCLGAGILTMHEAYKNGGLWTSLGVGAVLSIIAPYNMLMLVRSAQTMYVRLRIPKMSYPDLAEAAVATGPFKRFRKCSRCVRYILVVFLFVELCGACNIYQIMMSYAFKQVLETLTGKVLNIRICALIVSVPIMLLCCIRSLKYLAPFSLTADLFMLVCVITTLYYSFRSMGSISLVPAWKNMSDFFHFLGMYIYATDGMTMVLPIENNMTRPIYFSSVVWFGMPIVYFSCNLVGFFGYWGWGEACKSPVTMNMPQQEVFTIILHVIFMPVMAITFSVHFWVPFRIIWRHIGNKIRHKRHFWETVCRCLHVLVITAGSVAFPNLNELISFIGIFFLSVITFIFPPCIETLVMWKARSKYKRSWKVAKNLGIIMIGLTVFFGGLYHSIKKLIV